MALVQFLPLGQILLFLLLMVNFELQHGRQEVLVKLMVHEVEVELVVKVLEQVVLEVLVGVGELGRQVVGLS
jgi:hypothetical protein